MSWLYEKLSLSLYNQLYTLLITHTLYIEKWSERKDGTFFIHTMLNTYLHLKFNTRHWLDIQRKLPEGASPKWKIKCIHETLAHSRNVNALLQIKDVCAVHLVNIRRWKPRHDLTQNNERECMMKDEVLLPKRKMINFDFARHCLEPLVNHCCPPLSLISRTVMLWI